ncbi:hypothetical protein [Methanococcus maripaludis]|uniref:Uncharacterized protein n=1 Tax=Methanococcus maripaludis TaxID=39152 RepID=A0A7J9PQS6_METMI|nr:hypothetical protein [Methanococcus maripaludis]MBA2868015.1 hypothetical protein [Methanococcus maripaludis]
MDIEFANPLIKKLKDIDWTDYTKDIEDEKEGKTIVNSLKRKPYYEPHALVKIESEEDFLNVISNAFEELRHYVEDQRWIEPFWNDGDSSKPNSPTPKRETKIQPTLKVFFEKQLDQTGVHVVREPHEGTGVLDFKFLITINGKRHVLCLEFKLAHNNNLKHGLTTQLPSYLKANRYGPGIFFVMWFKDEKGEYFEKPINKTKSEMIKYLEKKVKELNEKEGYKIESVLIDASIKPSASKS